MENKTGLDSIQIAKNMVFSILAFVLNTGISFFLTPYITAQLGSEAYGYVKLANDFAGYATLITLALNSMSSRFIVLNRSSGKFEEASKYYNSLLIANIFLGLFFMVPSTVVVLFLERLISIPLSLILTVKITFALTFTNFILDLIFSIFSNCYYLTNRLEIQALLTTKANLIRTSAIILLFIFLKPSIIYMVLGTTFSSLYLIVSNIRYSKKLVPDLKIEIRMFQFTKVKELVVSGVWNSITKLSQIFTSGLSLLITNIFISSQMMGYLSVAKTIPNLIVNFNGTIANAFSSNLMILYAKNAILELRDAVKISMKTMCVFIVIPNAILLSLGYEFFKLWTPEQPSDLLNVLSVLSVINACVTGPMQPLYQIFTITNKIKQSSIVMIVYGFISIVVTMGFLKFSDLGVFAVVGVSAVGSVIVALCYHLPFGAKYLGLPWYEFYPEIGKSIVSYVLVAIIGFTIKHFIRVGDSWLLWFSGAVITAILGFLLNVFLVLNKQDRQYLFQKIFKRKKAS